MAKSKRLCTLCLVMVLCLCLTACDLESMLGSLNPFAARKDEAIPNEGLPGENLPVYTRPEATEVETQAPTEALTEAPTEPQPELYWVCAIGGLNVRSGPSRDYSPLGTIDDGTVIEPIRWVDGWVYIESPMVGWCSADYVHPLGWYNNVQLPVGDHPENTRLVGKWIHGTEPEFEGSRRRSRVGVLNLSRDGTFTHSVAEYISYTSDWKIAEDEYSKPVWIGEYQFDGKTLTLNYMAYVDTTYDRNGNPTSRQYLSAPYILELPVTLSNDTLYFSIPNGEIIPCHNNYGTMPTTRNVLYRASNSLESPQDVCDALRRWFS